MKKGILALIILALSVFMICACAGTPSSSTESGADDTPNLENSDTESGKNITADSDKSEIEDTKKDANIVTQLNKKNYEQISAIGREYICGDFPNEYGEYYKLVKTFDEFKKMVTNVDDVDPSLFEDNYIAIINRHYESDNTPTFIGYRNAKFYEKEKASIIIDCYHYSNRPYTEGYKEMNLMSYVLVPKNVVSDVDDSVHKLNIVYDLRDYYNFEIATVPTEKASELHNGKAWLLNDDESLNEISDQYNLNKTAHDFKNKDIYLLAIYTDKYYYYGIGFKDFYTDGQNIYITYEKIGLENVSSNEKPTIYFVEIPKSLIEHEMSEEIVVHFLLQKTDITMIK